MKYVKNMLVFILLLFTSTLNASALSCSNADTKDLGQIASYVKASYEVIDNSTKKELTIDNNTTTYTVPNYTFEISIYNITDDIYVTVTDDVLKNSFTVYKNDTTDGTYTFTDNDFGTIYNYTISILSANDNCYGEKVRTIKLARPKYNAYSEYTYCQNSSNLYCQKFITQDLNINSSSEFLNKIKTNNEKNNPDKEENEENNTIKTLFQKHWKLYLGILAVVIVLLIAIIIVIHKRNKNKGWRL